MSKKKVVRPAALSLKSMRAIRKAVLQAEDKLYVAIGLLEDQMEIFDHEDATAAELRMSDDLESARDAGEDLADYFKHLNDALDRIKVVKKGGRK